MGSEMVIGNKKFLLGSKTYIVGILNVTPNSFSDGGKFFDVASAMEHVERMISQGADIIDIGGESTKPGYKMISDDEEIERIVPVIRQIKSQFDIPISIDTYKSKVALEAIKAGADCINDIWGLKHDEKMAGLVKKYDLPVCIVHNRAQKDSSLSEDAFILKMKEEILQSISIAKKAGISDDKIIIDPGIGFGKTYEQNLCCVKNLSMWKEFGYPILLGASRKSFIGEALNLPVGEREEATIAISALAAMNGCDFLRVHDVEKNYRAVAMTKIIFGGEDKFV